MNYLISLSGVMANAGLILLGSVIGLLLKEGLPEKLKDGIFTAIALCVLYVGISGAMKTVTEDGVTYSADVLAMIFSLVVGTVIGTLTDLDGRLDRLGKKTEARFSQSGGSVSAGFVNATLLFCIGAMAITGPIESALFHDNSTLLAKGVIDGISAMIFTISFGWGVALSIVPLIIYQGGIALIATALGQAFLTPIMNVEIIAVGSLIIVSIALNMLNLTKIKTANMLPSIFLAPVFAYLFSLL